MGQDLRELFKNNKEDTFGKPPKGHEKRFDARLVKNFPMRKRKSPNNFYWMAAGLLILLGIGYFMPKTDQPNHPKKTTSTEKAEGASPVFLSDVSPEYKKVEDYYLAAIHTELAQLNITAENKALIDSFMKQLSELDDEYKRLNNELKVVGVNERTVSVLIENLKLRMDLLFKLKNKLSELKKPATGTI